MLRHAPLWLALSILPLTLQLSACSGCSADVAGIGDGGADGGGGGAVEDGGVTDAGVTDAGVTDAGSDDAGNSGSTADGGEADSGDADSGDAGGGVACQQDSQCSLGEVCRESTCVPGCTDDRDCPGATPLCDLNLGAYGACVICLGNDDCGEEGRVCREGACFEGCSAAEPGCPAEFVCDTGAGVCVGCLEDSNCELGEICEAQSCTPGCRENRDCPEGLICNAEQQCVEGCSAAPNDSCPAGTHCVQGSCALGCNGDDGRCGAEQICVDEGGRFACRDACEDVGDCGANTTCQAGACVSGCATSDDCGTFTSTPICDTSAGTPGTCVACLDDDDCLGRQTCHPEARTCQLLCSVIQNCGLIGQVCDESTDRCVACLENNDCDDGETCNTATNQCERPAAGLCGECEDDADCGDETSLCVRRFFGLLANEAACGIDCSDLPCPQGYECAFVGAPVVRGRQCVPTSSVVEFPTCAAIRDLEAEAECNSTFQCGALQPEDGFCRAEPGEAGVCTLRCAANGDCPAGYACELPPPDADDEVPGVCAPL